MTNEEIIQRGQLINDETEPAQNTSERVGGVIKGIGQNLADKDAAIAAEAARNGYYQCTVSGTTLAVTAPGFTLPAHGGNIRIKMSAPATGACTLNINSTVPRRCSTTVQPFHPRTHGRQEKLFPCSTMVQSTCRLIPKVEA